MGLPARRQSSNPCPPSSRRLALNARAIGLQRQFWAGLLAGLLAGCTQQLAAPIAPATSPSPPPPLRYDVHTLPDSNVYTLTIPREGNYELGIALASSLTPLTELVSENGAIAGINGGYFDPQNAKTTSFITSRGKLVGDPRLNPRLIGNPKLKPYLKAILNRSEFRHYRCNDGVRYAITFYDAPIPPSCELRDAIGAGPQLLPVLTDETEGFVTKRDGQVVRDAIGVYQKNARTAIAITERGDVLWAMVSQTANGQGMTLPELAEFLKSQGAIAALNLDGGSSSSFVYEGKAHFGRRDREGNFPQRAILSAVVLLAPNR